MPQAVLERVLTYDRTTVAQETGWWCGPATVQNLLNALGIKISEAEIARDIEEIEHPGQPDDRDGTDYIGLLEVYLDRKVPQAKYTTVGMPNDPPTANQSERLWRDLKKSIDAGYGVAANIVAPPWNRPKGVNGSTSPAYPPVTTFHYFAIMGYREANGVRMVWIADSAAFGGITGFWMSFDQLATLIPPKGYCFADVGVPIVVVASERVDAPDLNPVAALSEAMGNALVRERYSALLPAVSKCLADCGATTVPRIAMWMAQIGHESGGLRWMAELADGSAYEGRSDLGNIQRGDGPRYKGRGPIQVTGRSNYTNLSKWAYQNGLCPTPTYFVDAPDELASDKYGFVGVTWYWTTQRDLNGASDRRDLNAATKMINGGLNGIDDRKARYERAILMGDRLLSITANQPKPAEPKPAEPKPLPPLVVEEVAAPKVPAGQFTSLSAYRTPGESSIGDLTQIIRNVDAMTHQMFTEMAATKYGEPESIYRVFRSAAGKGAVTTVAFIAHSQAVLKQVPQDKLDAVLKSIERNEPDLIKTYLEIRGK